jgi:coenzyme F420-dependent glucose-6-phosphate dehydrogenase
MPAPQIWFAAAHEQFPPSDLLAQAVEAAAAGFDGLACSDHFQPWWPEGQSGNALVWLGAAAQATQDLPIGTSVTPVAHRYHPAVIAQAFMTLEEMFPGRVYLGVGSGEALNEVPVGDDWPSVGDQIARMDEGLDIIERLWAGEEVTHDGRFYRTEKARLYTRAAKPPRLYVSAFGPQAARVAARHGDGLWSLADPEKVPEILATYRAARTEAGRDPGEVILQVPTAWAEDEERLLEGSRMWKATQPPAMYIENIPDPARMQDMVSDMSDADFVSGALVSTDPDEHVEKLASFAALGATVLCLQNISGADPHGTIRTYGETVLPRLRERLGS